MAGGLTRTQGRRSLRNKPEARRRLQAVLGAKGLQGQLVLYCAEGNRSRQREGVPKAPRRGLAGQSQAPTSGSPTAGRKTAGGRAARNSRPCSHPNLGASVHTHKHTYTLSLLLIPCHFSFGLNQPHCIRAQVQAWGGVTLGSLEGVQDREPGTEEGPG